MSTNKKDQFQRMLKEDVKKIRKSDKCYVFADKTNNIYTMPPAEHNRLLDNNVTKTYEKADKLLEKAINSEAREIAKSYKIDNRAEIMPKSEAFISLKDHKDNFHQNYP